MDQDRLTGMAKNAAGGAEETFGRVVGDAKAQAEGKVRQAQGMVQEAYGQAKEQAKESASSLDDGFRRFIEDQPYTAAAIALAVGWVIGRSHRPI
jgi:uncharacterized protein YjbJ (UPF0337 family)